MIDESKWAPAWARLGSLRKNITNWIKRPQVDEFHSIIDAIIAADEEAPPKQRHTAMQIYRRLRHEYKYSGQYDAVLRYIRKHLREQRDSCHC